MTLLDYCILEAGNRATQKTKMHASCFLMIYSTPKCLLSMDSVPGTLLVKEIQNSTVRETCYASKSIYLLQETMRKSMEKFIYFCKPLLGRLGEIFRVGDWNFMSVNDQGTEYYRQRSMYSSILDISRIGCIQELENSTRVTQSESEKNYGAGREEIKQQGPLGHLNKVALQKNSSGDSLKACSTRQIFI